MAFKNKKQVTKYEFEGKVFWRKDGEASFVSAFGRNKGKQIKKKTLSVGLSFEEIPKSLKIFLKKNDSLKKLVGNVIKKDEEYGTYSLFANNFLPSIEGDISVNQFDTVLASISLREVGDRVFFKLHGLTILESDEDTSEGTEEKEEKGGKETKDSKVNDDPFV